MIAASGSSRHAGLAAEIMLEDLAGLAVDVEYASEYVYRSTHTIQDPGVLVISQSGETADTLAALREAKVRGLRTLAITNNPHSSMAIEAEASLPTYAGREQAIPATKSFTTQLAVLYALALFLARLRGRMTLPAVEKHCEELRKLPSLLEPAIERWRGELAAIAPELRGSRAFLYLGRGVHYAIAREGALKLKESAYLQAEGYPAGELKHGPNALVGSDAPLVFIATSDPLERRRHVALPQSDPFDEGDARTRRDHPGHCHGRRRGGCRGSLTGAFMFRLRKICSRRYWKLFLCSCSPTKWRSKME